jgi:DNA-directed RNA polymerase subunit RPC12/RpoP
MKNKTKKTVDILMGCDPRRIQEEDADKKFRCLICGAKQLGSEMSYHPAPHCKECGSKLVVEAE